MEGGGGIKNPFSAMPVGSGTRIPYHAAGGGATGMRRWACGGPVSLGLFVAMLLGSGALLVWGPHRQGDAAARLRSDPSFVDPSRVDPSLYTDFRPQLILREGHEDWVSFDQSVASHYYTEAEMATLPPGEGRNSVCQPGEDMPQHCCLGSFSLAGLMAWDGAACKDANFFKFQVPHSGLGLARYHDMGDVLGALGNRTLAFLGDSVTSQHAHAMECSWLRSGKAKTLTYEKDDYHRIFSTNGTGFSRAGRYGTNALYTWHTEMADTGVQATMRLFLTYRPWLNETLATLSASDVVVVNFGLHYLMEDKKVFQEEMHKMLEAMRPFASTAGKALVWRENSAQHHLSEGGEFPVTEFPERLGMSRKEYMTAGALCHDLKFGAKVGPQWRDKMVLAIADSLGYKVHFLGSYGDRHLSGGEAVTGLTGRRARRRGGRNATACATHKQQQHQQQVGEAAPVLYWMPFFRITAERNDLHPYNPWRKRYDCTHYCYTPLLWDPLVDGLYASVDDARRREDERDGDEDC